jgi:hypothetical protein
MGPSPTEFLVRYRDAGEAAVAEPFKIRGAGSSTAII